MLPTAALPTSLASPLTLEPGPLVGMQPAEISQFEAILAGTVELAVTPLTCLQELAGTADAEPVPAAELPEVGKDLPDPASATVNAPDPAAVLALLPVLPVPPVKTDPAAPLQSTLDAAPLKAAPPLPIAVPHANPSLKPVKSRADQSALASVPLKAMPPASAPTAAPALASLTQAAAAPLAPVALPHDPARKAAVAVQTATAPLIPDVAPDRPAAPPIEATLGIGTSQSQAQPLALIAIANPSPTAPFTMPASVQGPQDFAQLIDRLVAARETAQPQAARLALAHAEFGPVELQFSQDSNGLSVTLASNDPDFARAVQAAVPPVSASSESMAAQARSQGQGSAQQGGSGTNQPQAQGGAQPGSSGGGQPHSQPGNHGASPGTAQDRPAGRNPGGTPPEAPGSQQGIFA